MNECINNKYSMNLVQNIKAKKWIEIEIGIKQNIELGTGQDFKRIEEVKFLLCIGKGYPIRDVRVYTVTTFVKPSLADGRNLLPDILNKNWCYKYSLKMIVVKLPEFLERVLIYRKDKIFLQNIGQYYLGNIYTIDELKEFPDLIRFPTIQMSNAFFQSISVRLACLSEAHFYLFEVIESEGQDQLKLIFRAPLQSCVQLKKKKDQNSEITLIWKNYKTKQEEIQQYKITEYDLFIRVFLRKLNFYTHIRMTSNSYAAFGDQSINEKNKINAIVKNLHQLEMDIEKKFNQDNITKLMDLYQQAIEFYSSASDYLYEIYLNKLQSLIQREDVQVILQYKK